jgi:hypothetical protein
MVDDRVATPGNLKWWLRISKKSIKLPTETHWRFFERRASGGPLIDVLPLPSSQIAV